MHDYNCSFQLYNNLVLFAIELYALHTAQQSAQFLDVQGWGQLHSIDTEDEDQSTESKRLSWSQQLHGSSEEKVSKLVNYKTWMQVGLEQSCVYSHIV